jgi:hypothetical protein
MSTFKNSIALNYRLGHWTKSVTYRTHLTFPGRIANFQKWTETPRKGHKREIQILAYAMLRACGLFATCAARMYGL